MRNRGLITDPVQLFDLMSIGFEFIWRPQDQSYVIRKMKNGLVVYYYSVQNSLAKRLIDEGKIYVKTKTRAYQIFAKTAENGGGSADSLGRVEAADSANPGV